MSADDLRTRAWEAADKAADLHLGALPVSPAERWHRIGYVSGYAAGYLAHAAQQPSRDIDVDELARVIDRELEPGVDPDRIAAAVKAWLTGDESDE